MGHRVDVYYNCKLALLSKNAHFFSLSIVVRPIYNAQDVHAGALEGKYWYKQLGSQHRTIFQSVQKCA